MALPSLARLSIERAAPTAAPSDAPAPLATPSADSDSDDDAESDDDVEDAEDVLGRLAQQEQAAIDAVVSFLEVPRVPGEQLETPFSELHEQAVGALKAFVGKACEYLRGALMTEPADPIARADGLRALFALNTMWDIYSDASKSDARFASVENYRRLIEGELHAAAEESGLYSIVAQLLDPAKGAPRVRRQCPLLVHTMVGDDDDDLNPFMIKHRARSALVEASDGRIGSLLLATLDDPVFDAAATRAATVGRRRTQREALRALRAFTRASTDREKSDLQHETLERRVSVVLAADEKIAVLLRMFGNETASGVTELSFRRMSLLVLSNVLCYTNEPSPLIERILEHNVVTTITEQFKLAYFDDAGWLNREMALAFLRRFLYALYMADVNVVERAFGQFEEATFVPTMLAYWKILGPLTDSWFQIGRLFGLFGRMDERYPRKPNPLKWQRALTSGWERDEGVFAHLETGLVALDASANMQSRSLAVLVDLLKYTLLPTPEVWERAKTAGGLLDWMIEAATLPPLPAVSLFLQIDAEAAKENRHALHSVLSELAARDSGIAEWMLSSNPDGMRDNFLIYSWAPKRSPLRGYANGFRALLRHGTAYDHMTLLNAQRAAGMPMPPLLEEWEQWDWGAVAETLKDPEVAASAAVRKPGPSVHAALLVVLHIVQVLEEDPSSPDDPVAEIGREPMRTRDKLSEWDALLKRLMNQHEGNLQFASSLAYWVEKATALLWAPKSSNAAFILSKRRGDWPEEEEADDMPKRARTTTTDAVYARFLDLAQLRL